MPLEKYNAKRRFDVTSEPPGRTPRTQATAGNAFVIQKHDATRLHYDLRLELDGVMLSWAVTRGPSLVPGEKRLAVHVEDHPIEYNDFEGTIPKGQYGGGTVMIWDRGVWTPERDARASYKKGRLDFRLDGEKLSGAWHLVRMRKREGERQDPWLLIKASDEAARAPDAPDILEELPLSATSGRTMDEIAGSERVWHSNRVASGEKVTKAAKPSSLKLSKTGAEPTKEAGRRAKPSTAEKKVRSSKPPISPVKIKQPARPRQRKAQGAAKASRSSAETDDGRLAANRRGKAADLPDFLAPALTTLSRQAPEADSWVHEIKFDGYRMQARLAPTGVTLKTRTGLDWTEKFQNVAEALDSLSVQDAIIDGEIVVEGDNRTSSFTALQEALKTGIGAFTFYVFDLLHLDGRDLRAEPLLTRKTALQDLLNGQPNDGPIRFSEHFDIAGPALLKHACELGLEGIVSKLRDASYREGRSGDWVKTKCSDRQEFIILGYAPATNDPRAIGALILGYNGEGGLHYAGRVGTGFTDAVARDLWAKLSPLRLPKTPLARVPDEERGRKGIWVAPQLVCEIDFRGWTGARRLRHPSFKGLRADKSAAEVVREDATMVGTSAADQKKPATRKPAKPAASPATPAASPATLHLTNPNRVYWDDVGLTKQGLAEYYQEVWDWIAPHVVGRALSLVRCPEGAAKHCFFQKHASAGLDGKRLRLVPEDDDHVIAIDGLDGALALVQAGVLEIHVRGSTIERLDAANRIVFDLDPSPEVGWKEVVTAARDVRTRLQGLGLESFLKTTGGKGLHVVVPIVPAPWDAVKAFTRAVAYAMAADEPARFLAVASKRERTGRIFVDYLRNSREATAICAYSTRSRPGATVSVPISWSELSSLATPNRYTVGNLFKRLRGLKQDPWADIGRVEQALPSPKKV